MKVTTAERLKQIMSERRLRQVDIIEMAKPYCKEYNLTLSKSDLSQFVNGKVEPGQWKLTLLGKALNVSEVWLMGYDVPMERPEQETAPIDDEERDKVVKLFNQLSEENQQRLLDYAEVLLKAQKASSGQQG